MDCLPPEIEVYQGIFWKEFHCKKCGLVERINDNDFMKATKIDFNHDYRPLIAELSKESK